MEVDPIGNEASNVAQASGDDDLALLRGFSERGDRAALGALFSRHADAAYRFALRLTRRPADAEDVLQSAFLEVFRHASSFRGRASVRTWILGFVLHVSRNKAREESRRKARQEKAAAQAATSAVPTTLDPEMADRLRRAVDDLPEHYRAPLWLHYGEGFSTDEVANVLDLSPDTVRKQLSRGIDRLKNDLLPYGAAMSVGTMLASLAVETAPPSVTAAVLQTAPAVAASGVKVGVASKVAATVAAAVAIASSATFLWWGGRIDDLRPREFAEIDRRVQEWQPTPEERRFDEIGWVATIGESLRRSRESGRPVVLLTQSGRIELGRSDGGSQFIRSRALADPEVISILNAYFVPVYVSNPDFEELGTASAEERRLRDRIWRSASESKQHWGMDCLYLLDPADGRVCDTLTLGKANPAAMRGWLKANRRTPPGSPLVPPSSQSKPPSTPTGTLVLHVAARYLDSQGHVERERADFHEVPAEDWLALPAGEWEQFLPPETGSRSIDSALAERILTHLHPADMSIADPNERNRIQVADLKVTRLSRSYARIEGRLEMRRSFTQVAKSEERPVVAALKGFVELERDGRRIRSLRLISEGATYGSQNFGVAIRSIP